MKELLTFDDVLIKPKFSYLTSRKEVDLSTELKLNYVTPIFKLKLPILSANMDTVTGPTMAVAMAKSGGLGVLHRFLSIEDNVSAYKEVLSYKVDCAVSVGVGEQELERAKALYEAGARIFVLDVAHGAQLQVVAQYANIKEICIDSFVIVGNFATAESCAQFWAELNQGGVKYYRTKKGELHTYGVDAFKIGVGPGSACTTRIKTGCGVPQLSAVLEVANHFKDHVHRPLIICDGGMRTSGDIAKALAAGADLVMLGGMLAGTDETPGEVLGVYDEGTWKYDENTGKPISASFDPNNPKLNYSKAHKKYRGSASKESYTDQGKDTAYRTAEGESFVVPYKGPVAQVLQEIEGGLRSAFTYVGARNVQDFQEKAEFVTISSNGTRENGAHGKV